MITYRDRTYCVSESCDNRKCDIRLTKEVERKAAELRLPISVCDESKNCPLFERGWWEECL